jgi:hypothetical protein
MSRQWTILIFMKTTVVFQVIFFAVIAVQYGASQGKKIFYFFSSNYPETE